MFKVLNDGRCAVQGKTQEDQKQEIEDPFSDPNVSDAMMNIAKGNMASYIPQTIIMWQVNHFFAGFVLMKVPFPLASLSSIVSKNGTCCLPKFREFLVPQLNRTLVIPNQFTTALSLHPLVFVFILLDFAFDTSRFCKYQAHTVFCRAKDYRAYNKKA